MQNKGEKQSYNYAVPYLSEHLLWAQKGRRKEKEKDWKVV